MTEIAKTRLSEYCPPKWLVSETDLNVEITKDKTVVYSTLKMTRNGNHDEPIVLDGQDLELIEVWLDYEELKDSEYKITKNPNGGDFLTIPTDCDVALVSTGVNIYPNDNTALEGFYKSGEILCTQCESEGFRRITYYPDRPDVMAKFKTTITADRTKYPILLSNGNLTFSADLPLNQHTVTWEDPFPKASYLFAMVAGEFTVTEDFFRTMSGRHVRLQIFTDPGDEDKTEYAMRALKMALTWDEIRYGREYGLDLYMIVATSHFNYGAMENTGLNIFNSSACLASPETACDMDIMYVIDVIAHENFHYWTGNRVTLANWFQLFLKEGLTSYRDQRFMETEVFGPLWRINAVKRLWALQFPEDAGPMAHPVRPSEYKDINIFYTPTVYRKGAEIFRMLENILGSENWRRGMNFYFARHDGQAVCAEDLIKVLEDASGRNLSDFTRWFYQAGTPVIHVKHEYNPKKKTLTLTLRQRTAATPGQTEKVPLVIPVKMGLVNPETGDDIPLQLLGSKAPSSLTRTLILDKSEKSFVFLNVGTKAPIPSLFREYSAPVKMTDFLSDNELAILAQHDSDPFNRWYATREYFGRNILKAVRQVRDTGVMPKINKRMVKIFRENLKDEKTDQLLVAELLTLPGEVEIGNMMHDRGEFIAVNEIHMVRKYIRKELLKELELEFQTAYFRNTDHSDKYSVESADIAKRRIKNISLGFLCLKDDNLPRAFASFTTANNMTDELAALSILSNNKYYSEIAFEAFFKKWDHNSLVMQNWFAVQALRDNLNVLLEVKELTKHEHFDKTNPSIVRSLIGSFASNPAKFHAIDGSGYQFLADWIIKLNKVNFHISAGLAKVFAKWKMYDPLRQSLMTMELRRIEASGDLNKMLADTVKKILAD